jgi:hypothetical protein
LQRENAAGNGPLPAPGPFGAVQQLEHPDSPPDQADPRPDGGGPLHHGQQLKPPIALASLAARVTAAGELRHHRP